MTTQALLQLLDMGMAPTINREVARCSASGNLKEAGKLLHTLAVVYWSMAGAIALLILALAPLIAEYWLQSKQLSPQTISHAVMLMGLLVSGCIDWGAPFDSDERYQYGHVTIGSLGAVAVLAFVSPTIEAFFIWQACVSPVYASTMRLAAWRIIGKLNQIRKVILSKMLGLEEFGHYMLATVVVSGLSVLVTPLFNVMYPRFSALVVAGETEKLIDLYRPGTRMLATVLFPIAMVLAVFAEDLVLAWTG